MHVLMPVYPNTGGEFVAEVLRTFGLTQVTLNTNSHALDCYLNHDGLVIYTYRNFLSVLLTQLRSEWSSKSSDLPFCTYYKQIYPRIPFDAFVNLVLETNYSWVEDEVREWHRATIPILTQNVQRLNMDKCLADPKLLVEQLGSRLEATRSHIRQVKERIRKGYFTDKFLQVELPRPDEGVFDEPLLARLKQTVRIELQQRIQ